MTTEKNNRVGFDIDEVLFGFMDRFSQMVGKKPAYELWNFYADWGWSHDEFIDTYSDLIVNHGLFEEGELEPSALESMGLLKEKGYDIIICTVRGVDHGEDVERESRIQTMNWLNKNGVPYDEVIFTKDKTDSRTFCFFDDHIAHYRNLAEKSDCTPWLYDTPYNRRFTFARRIRSLGSAYEAVIRSERIKNNNGEKRRWDEFLV